jgi:hypothetical protein
VSAPLNPCRHINFGDENAKAVLPVSSDPGPDGPSDDVTNTDVPLTAFTNDVTKPKKKTRNRVKSEAKTPSPSKKRPRSKVTKHEDQHIMEINEQGSDDDEELKESLSRLAFFQSSHPLVGMMTGFYASN